MVETITAALIDNGVVVNLVAALEHELSATVVPLNGRHCAIGYRWDGVQFTEPPLTQDDILRIRGRLIAAVQIRLDAFAQSRGYDDIVSACSYATSTHPRYGPEGRYCVSAREATWDAMFAVQAAVEAGTRPMPMSLADIESDLPALTWPTE